MVTKIIKIAMAPSCFHCIMLTQNVYEKQNLKEVGPGICLVNKYSGSLPLGNP